MPTTTVDLKREAARLDARVKEAIADLRKDIRDALAKSRAAAVKKNAPPAKLTKADGKRVTEERFRMIRAAAMAENLSRRPGPTVDRIHELIDQETSRLMVAYPSMTMLDAITRATENTRTRIAGGLW